MKTHALALGLVAATSLLIGACNNNSAENGEAAQTPAAEKAAGEKTIAAGLAANSQFLAVAKSAGLDQTLAGPGPYTVFVPADAAFGSAPEGTFATTPENRPQITGVLTNLILPGTVLAADLGKAIDAGKGKAQIASMSGGLLTFAKEGGNIVITDSSGKKATVTKADDQYSNGVVHHIDAVLMPGKQGGAAQPAAGDKAPTP